MRVVYNLYKIRHISHYNSYLWAAHIDSQYAAEGGDDGPDGGATPSVYMHRQIRGE